MSFPRTVFMFSGQGSQYRTMGRTLFEADPVFRDELQRLDRMASDLTGKRVLEEMHAGSKADSFDRTLITHPAIFMLEYALARSLAAKGLKPDLCLGASLGTFAAAAVAGHLGVEDAMRAVVAQARAFEATCERGGILAILAPPSLYDEAAFLHARSELSGINFDKHFAVSCAPSDLAAIEQELKQRAIACQRLDVSYAFHSRWIDPAAEAFLADIRDLALAPGAGLVACCAKARTLSRLSPGDFWDAVRQPIRFRDTIARLETDGPCRYIDVGPSGTLATFVKYALPAASRSTTHPILTPFGQDTKHLASLLAVMETSAA